MCPEIIRVKKPKVARTFFKCDYYFHNCFIEYIGLQPSPKISNPICVYGYDLITVELQYKILENWIDYD